MARQTDIKAFVRDIKQIEGGRAIVRLMTKEFRKESRPALNAVRQKIKTSPSKGVNARRGRPSLRQALAKATIMQVKTTRSATVQIKVDPKKMPEGLRGIPPYVEGNARWRHPVFGDKPWVRQGKIQFFYGTLAPYESKIRAAGDRVIAQIKKELEG